MENLEQRIQKIEERNKFVQEIEKDVIVSGDRALLERALQQLLDNSCKYSKNRPRIRIEFGRKQIDGRSVCFVRDNGEGFDSANAKDLFTPFHRFLAALAAMERDAIPAYPPENRDQPGNAEALGEHGKDILPPHQSAVKQRQARQCHEQDQRRRSHLPGVVAGAG